MNFYKPEVASPWRTGGALAMTVGVFYVLCTSAWLVAPGPFLNFMNALFHGIDFSSLVQPRPFDWLGFLAALLMLSGWALFAGTFFAWVHHWRVATACASDSQAKTSDAPSDRSGQCGCRGRSSSHKRQRGSATTWIFGGFPLVALFFLLTEHRAHLYGWLPFLLVAICPLMHLFHVHGGHARHDSRSADAELRQRDTSPPATHHHH